MRMLTAFVALFAVLLPQRLSAKCARRESYLCVRATFDKERPDRSRGEIKSRCVGSLKLRNKSVTRVFADDRPCPAPGAPVAGHLRSLCQDTGDWTTAEYVYTRG